MRSKMIDNPNRFIIVQLFSQNVLAAPQWSLPFAKDIIFPNGLEIYLIDTHLFGDVELLSKVIWDLIFISFIRGIHNIIISFLESFKLAPDLIFFIGIDNFILILESKWVAIVLIFVMKLTIEKLFGHLHVKLGKTSLFRCPLVLFMSQFFLSFVLLVFRFFLFCLGVHVDDIFLEKSQRLGLKFGFTDKRLEVVDSHFTILFSGEFVFILVLTVKGQESALLIDVVSQLLLLIFLSHEGFLEVLVDLSLVLCDQIK